MKISVFIVLVFCTLLLVTASKQYHQRFSSKPLAMTFAHADHAKQQCVSCHHNYQDNTGQGLCLECHHNDERTAFQIRDQFHELCMGCHVELREQGDEAGPQRSCAACHTADDRP